ncbi:hypothetical protein WJX72_006381 [[Myrmecia] bisecta]|uniref:Uncharacterized protein n=1 Tax=[Myrmecia] bisecta TaxID=41462 RepID=A0AAW1PT98_9CHLO
MNKQQAEQLNLVVLKRVDPDTEEVLASAGHVALYDFNEQESAWARKDVEGSLFLLKRKSQPRFQFIILNKKSQDNYVEDVLGGFQFEQSKPYLLYRNKKNEVVGIWFYDAAECDKFDMLLQRITSAFAQTPALHQLPTDVQVTATRDGRPQTDQQATPSAGRESGPAHLPTSQPHHPPFPDAGPPDASAGSADVDPLTRLFASMRTGAAAASTPPPATGSQRSQPSTAHMPFAAPLAEAGPPSAEPTLPVRASLDMPSSAHISPVRPAGQAQQPGTAPPVGLLTPSFFQKKASGQLPGAAPSTPGVAPAAVDPTRQDSNALKTLLARAAGNQAGPALPSQGQPSGSQAAGSPARQVDAAERDRMRQALTRLVQSDRFVDLIVSELKSSNLLR